MLNISHRKIECRRFCYRFIKLYEVVTYFLIKNNTHTYNISHIENTSSCIASLVTIGVIYPYLQRTEIRNTSIYIQTYLLYLGHTFTDKSPGWLRMKMVRMMPEKWLSLSYYGISTVKTGLIRFRYRNNRDHVGKKNGFLRFVTVYYGLNENDS